MDDADRAQDRIDADLEAAIAANAAEIRPGVEGECDLCGEWSGRWIDGACAPCRDKYGLE